jgi:hypothetical protein
MVLAVGMRGRWLLWKERKRWIGNWMTVATAEI